MKSALSRFLTAAGVVGLLVSTAPASAQMSPAELKAQRDREAAARAQAERQKAGAATTRGSPEKPSAAKKKVTVSEDTRPNAVTPLGAPSIATLASATDACQAAKTANENGSAFIFEMSDASALNTGFFIWTSSKDQFEKLADFNNRIDSAKSKWLSENKFFAISRNMPRYTNSYNAESEIFIFEDSNQNYVLDYLNFSMIKKFVELQIYRHFSSSVTPDQARNVYTEYDDYEIVRIFDLIPPHFEKDDSGNVNLLISNVCRFLRRKSDGAVAFFDKSKPLVPEPTPLSPPSSWITIADLPRNAYKEGRGGTVKFTLDVNLNGAVEKCSIVKSSGWQDVDEATCEAIRLRAKFKVPSHYIHRGSQNTYSNTVRWLGSVPAGGEITP